MIRKHCFFLCEKMFQIVVVAILKNISKAFIEICLFFYIRVDSEPCGPFMHKMCHNLISKFIVNIVCNALCAIQQYGVVALSLPSKCFHTHIHNGIWAMRCVFVLYKHELDIVPSSLPQFIQE